MAKKGKKKGNKNKNKNPTPKLPQAKTISPPKSTSPEVIRKIYKSTIPLSSKQIHDKFQILECFHDFWNDVKFTKGWETPHIKQSDLNHILTRAAEFIVLIRSELQSKDQSFHLTHCNVNQIKDLIRSLPENIHDPEKLIREIIYRNFKDSEGFLPGINQQILDKLIEKFQNQEEILKSTSNGTDLVPLLENTWSSTVDVIKDLFASFDKKKQFTELQTKCIKEIISHLEKIHSRAFNILESNKSMVETETNPKRQKTTEEVETVKPPETPATPEIKEKTTTAPPSEEQAKESTDQKVETEPTGPSPAELKIEIIEKEISGIESGLKSLSQSASKLDYENLNQNPEAGQQLVEQLQKKCTFYTENLMKDLFTLDEIVNSPKARPKRKQQVQSIQQMMEDVDQISGKLKLLQQQLKKEIEEKSKKEKEQLEKKQLEEMEKQKELQKKQLELQNKQELERQQALENKWQKEQREKLERMRMQREERLQHKWKLLKLKPRMEVKEARDKFIIQSYIPGMNEKEIKIQLGKDKQTLIISGILEPTKEEEEQMISLIKERMKVDPYLQGEDEEMLLLRLGSGKYGRFEEVYELPPSVIRNEINATYNKGILTVTLPKRPILFSQQRTSPPPFHPFWTDRDSWWNF